MVVATHATSNDGTHKRRRFLGPGGPNPDVHLSITVSFGAVSKLLPSMFAEVMATGARHSSTHVDTYERTIRLRL